MNKPFFLFSLFLCLFNSLIINSAYASDNNDHNHQRLKNLLAPFQRISHIKLAYEEKRSSIFFKHAEKYSGTIEFNTPDQFIKTIEFPVRQKFQIIDQQLSIYTERGDTGQPVMKTIALDSYPQFKPVYLLFTGLLQGNIDYLNNLYRYQIETLAENKTRLILTPKITDRFTEQNQTINKIIEVIFSGDAITEINSAGFASERSELKFINLLEKQLKTQ
jgi:hypothetical protein